MGLAETGLNSEVVLILGGLNIEILLYHHTRVITIKILSIGTDKSELTLPFLLHVLKAILHVRPSCLGPVVQSNVSLTSR